MLLHDLSTLAWIPCQKDFAFSKGLEDGISESGFSFFFIVTEHMSLFRSLGYLCCFTWKMIRMIWRQ